MSRIDFKVVENGIKKADVPDDQNDLEAWESKRLMSRTIKTIANMGIKKVDAPDRLQGCREWNQKGCRPG
jgi:hypothetical protein